jgi:hypothetical protein
MFNMQKNDPWIIFLQNEPIILQLEVIILRRKINPGHYSTGVFTTPAPTHHSGIRTRDVKVSLKAIRLRSKFYYTYIHYFLRAGYTVSINIGPVRSQKLKFRHLQILWSELIVKYPQCIEMNLFQKIHVCIINIEFKTVAIIQFFLKHSLYFLCRRVIDTCTKYHFICYVFIHF